MFSTEAIATVAAAVELHDVRGHELRPGEDEHLGEAVPNGCAARTPGTATIRRII